MQLIDGLRLSQLLRQVIDFGLEVILLVELLLQQKLLVFDVEVVVLGELSVLVFIQ